MGGKAHQGLPKTVSESYHSGPYSFCCPMWLQHKTAPFELAQRMLGHNSWDTNQQMQFQDVPAHSSIPCNIARDLKGVGVGETDAHTHRTMWCSSN